MDVARQTSHVKRVTVIATVTVIVQLDLSVVAITVLGGKTMIAVWYGKMVSGLIIDLCYQLIFICCK